MRFILAIVLILGMMPVLSAQTAEQYYYKASKDFSESKQLGEALENVNAAIADRPTFAEAYNLRAKILVNTAAYDSAKLDFVRAVELQPDKISFNVDLASFLYDVGQYKESVKYYSEAIKLNKNDFNLYFYRSLAYLADGKSIQAMEDMDKAIGLNPGDPKMYARRALIRTKGYEPDNSIGIREYNLALEDMKTAISMNTKDANFYNQLGYIHFEMEQNLAALNNFSKAISLDPSQSEFYNRRGLVKLRIDDLRGAYNDFTAAIRLNDQVGYYYMNRGLSQLNALRYREAIDDYFKAVDLMDAQTESFRMAGAELMLGIALVNIDRKFDACDHFRKARDLGNVQGIYYLNRYCR